MIRKSKRIGALLLALVMIFSLFPASAFALDGEGTEETPKEVVDTTPTNNVVEETPTESGSESSSGSQNEGGSTESGQNLVVTNVQTNQDDVVVPNQGNTDGSNQVNVDDPNKVNTDDPNTDDPNAKKGGEGDGDDITPTRAEGPFTITFQNYDGTPLFSTEVEAGVTPAYSGETPTREEDDRATYTFSGWTPEIVAASDNATYTATYDETIKEYTVTFYDENGETVLQEGESVPYGAMPVFHGDPPTKTVEGETWRFAGWDPELAAVTGDADYNATFVQTFTVTYDVNGTTTSETVDKGGTVASMPSDPADTADQVFVGWRVGDAAFDPTAPINADTIVTAYFDAAQTAAITYAAGTGGTVAPASETVVINSKNPVISGATATAAEGYRFDKWTGSDGSTSGEATFTPKVPSGDVTYTASFVKVYTVNIVNRDAETTASYTKAAGEAITLPAPIARDDYYAYWALGTITEGEQGSEFTPDSSRRLNGSYTVSAADSVDGVVTIGPDYDKITYTVTFYKEDKTTEVATKTVDVDTNYCVNDIPAVPTKEGYSGKWVYSGGDFDNNVAVNANTSVWAEYDQSVFTVTFVVNGATYATDTYYKGNTLSLPADPVVEGKDFIGWYVGETKYSGGETVSSDLTLTAKFTDQFYVNFIVLNDQGEESERLSQYFRSSGEAIGTMPQDPFVPGKVFEKWVIQGTDTEVTAETVVTGNMTVVAVFRDITVYNITAEYWYQGSSGEVVFNTDLIQVEAHELPYTIHAPASTKTDPDEVEHGPIYYAETLTKEVKLSDFGTGTAYTVRFKYVPHTAVYDFVYLLKDLEGDGYSEIDRERDVHGVLNTTVTPTVKSFDYAVFEEANPVEITTSGMDGQPKQELPVKYTRKSFQLSYDTRGGSYVAGVTAPYGTSITLETSPTREGYTFAGWYDDVDETTGEAAGNLVSGSITLEKDTTLYAKWEGALVNYTVVYMAEKYNDAGTQTSYVYANSKTKQATVGSTVKAVDADAMTGDYAAYREKDTEKNADSSVVIAADGSSVLYVYYKLTEYTFYFNGGRFGNNNVRTTLPGKNVTDETGTLSYSFTAKLGQKISSLWPSSGTGRYNGNNPATLAGWKRPDDTTVYQDLVQYYVTTTLLPSSGTSIEFTAEWTTGDTTYKINIYLQNADDDNYTLSPEYSKSLVGEGWGWGRWGLTYSHDPINSYIYNRNRSTPDGTWLYEGQHRNPHMDLYYDREQYTIEYYYLSTDLDNSKTVKFGANINNNTYNWKPTAAQCGVDVDYTFDGWYADESLNSKYVFSTMPGSNLKLYAKWIAPEYDVEFVDADDGAALADTQTVEKYEKVTQPADPAKNGYVFDGWYTTADGDTLFDWNTQITGDTTVYAHWTAKTLEYVVHYYKAGTEESENPESVAPDKTVVNPNFKVDDEVTEPALAVTGYRPDANSKTLVLALEGNEITFVYSQKSETTSYTVNYVIADGETGAGTVVATQKKVENSPGDTASVIELAAAVDYDALYEAVPALEGVEFFPDATEKTLTLTSDEEQNVLTFYYSSFKNAKVTVNFVDMDGNAIATADSQVLKVGKTFTLSRTPIAGWELNKAVVGTAYSGTEAGSSYKITEEVAAGNGLTFTLFYQKKITITVNNQTKQYDGTALKLPTTLADQVTVEGLPTGTTLTSVGFSYANADNATNDGRVDAGVAVVTPKNATVTGHTNPNYYSIRYISGTLEVTKINVTVRIEPDRWVGAPYTGEPYYVGFTNPGKGVADYIMISHTDYARAYLNTIWNTVKGMARQGGAGLGYYCVTRTDVCDEEYQLGFTTANLPKNDNYSVSLFVRAGRVQILPAELTVTTGGGSKVYDGTALTNSTASFDGLVDADKDKGFSVSASGSQTEVGSSENEATITWGTVKPGNYKVIENYGTLTVTGAELTITVKDKTATYNGSEQEGYTIATVTGTGSTIETDDYKVEGLAENDVLTITYTPSKGTNIGTYNNGAFGTISISSDTEEGSNYSVTTTAGKLIINPAEVVITVANAEKTYGDADPSFPKATMTGAGSDLAGIDLTVSRSNAGTQDVGTYTDVLVISKTATELKQYYPNYTFTVNAGDFKINPKAVTITANDASKPYDGSPLTESGFTVSGQAEGDEHTFTVTMTTDSTITEVGTQPNVIATVDNVAVTTGTATTVGNYLVTTANGTLTVNRKAVTVKADDTGKIYGADDPSPLTATVTGLVGSDTITYTVVRAAGENVGTYAITASGAAEQGNYTVTYQPGTFTISKAKLVVTADNKTKTYGDADPELTWTVEGLKGSDTKDILTVAISRAAGENVGEYTITPSGVAELANYTVEYITGKLTITKAQVTVTADNKSKTYGENDPELTATVTGLKNGDAASVISYTLSREPGEDVGSYTITPAGEATQGNYDVIYATGTLTITQKAVVVKADDKSKNYGENDPELTATVTGLANGDEASVISYTLSREAGENVGSYTITPVGEATQGNYTVNYQTGTLTITKAGSLTVSAIGYTGTYDGESHAASATANPADGTTIE